MGEHRVLAKPTTSDIRWWWAEGVAGCVSKESAAEQFDRWLAEHDRLVAQKTLTDAAADLDGSDGLLTISGVRDALRTRAERLEC